MPIVRTVIILLSGLMLASCSLPYYTQSVYGHLRLMSKREPIAEIVADPDTDPELRAQLELVMEIRGFAVDQLALPDNGSYTKYAQLDGEYPVWNVFAAEEFSVDPITWCFPFTGCVAYRGYFSESRARGYADRLIERNAYDVWVGGAIAYSTLGHFKDPVLSSMLRYQDPWLAGLIFHEFAHQRLYVKGDSGFNEAFASVVGEIGMERWLASREGEDVLGTWRQGLAALEERSSAFDALLADTRGRLKQLYRSGIAVEMMRELKADEFVRLRLEADALFASWGDDHGYASWFDQPMNNARLLPAATYEGQAPAFRALYEDCGRVLACFYARAEEIATLPPDQRSAELSALAGAG